MHPYRRALTWRRGAILLRIGLKPGYSTPAREAGRGMRHSLRIAVMGLVPLLGSVCAAEEWHTEERPPFRVLYQAGNGAEARVLLEEAPGVLAALEADLGLHPEGPFIVRILPSRREADRTGDGAPHWAVGY